MNISKNSSEIKASDCFIGFGYILYGLDNKCNVVCKRFDIKVFGDETLSIAYRIAAVWLSSLIILASILWLCGISLSLIALFVSAVSVGLMTGISIHRNVVHNHMLNHCNMVKQEMIKDLTERHMSN